MHTKHHKLDSQATLSQREVDRLMDCARKYGRYGHRDATMILVAYRHGLRASEVCDLQWQQIELSEDQSRALSLLPETAQRYWLRVRGCS
jgi:integrase